MTLVGQGLTLGPLIQRLGLEPDRAEEYEEAAARLQTARAGLARLDDIAAGTIESAANTGAPSSVTPEALREVETQLRDRYSHLVHRFTAKARRHTGAKTDDAQSAEDQEADGIEASADANRAAAHHWLRLAMIDAERRELIRLRDTNKIGDDTLHRIEHGLDLEQMLLSRRDR